MSAAVVEQAQRLAKVLEHAAECGLPMPVTAHVNAELPSVILNMGSLEGLTDWAHWLEAPVEDWLTGLYWVDGEALEAPIAVQFTSPNLVEAVRS